MGPNPRKLLALQAEERYNSMPPHEVKQLEDLRFLGIQPKDGGSESDPGPMKRMSLGGLFPRGASLLLRRPLGSFFLRWPGSRSIAIFRVRLQDWRQDLADSSIATLPATRADGRHVGRVG